MSQNDDNLHNGHRKRMKKRFLENGFDGFSEHEILEFLLFFAIPRRNTNDLAHNILKEYKSLASVFESDPASLKEMDGVGENISLLLTMIPHLTRAYEQSKLRVNKRLCNTEDIGRYACSLLKGKTCEELALICVDDNRRVQWRGIIIKGTTDQLAAYPRLVLSEVVKHNTNHVILVHNHPGGSLAPSPADKETTKRLADILRTIDVKIIDHVIVCDNRYYSMAESGFIF